MMTRLLPFPGSEPPPGLSIEASARAERGILRLEYLIQGKVAGILWPERAASPGRRDELWKTTCLEAFVRASGGDRYWEVNLSPSGDWNIYRFDSYRQGMAPETSAEILDLREEKTTDRLRIEAAFRIPPLATGKGWKAGLTAVIQDDSGKNTYWALRHAGAKPDFHLFDGFVLELEREK